ncbi:MAG: ATP-binding protein [Alphaproteobacteria bacterium]|nr:ATP-binding protein [Alphaproteobacteria bacterium]
MNRMQSEPEIASEFRDYVYGVSHDVSAPVRAMVEFSRLLTGDHVSHLDEEGRLYLSLIIDNGEKLQKMMAGLLDYSRLNTEARPFAPVDCDAAVKDALLSLDDIIRAKQARIECGPMPVIIGDATQIWQLFVALIDNALKFQQAGSIPHIKIAAEKHKDMWQFSVSDNGIGIDERFREKIFTVFQRLHSGDDFPGIGIGLTLARKIVRRHGGEIRAESHPGPGVTLLFTLPVQGIVAG